MSKSNPKAKIRYFFDRDQSGHWYMVQADAREDWNTWLEIDPDDEAGWGAPDYAMMLSHDPSGYTFEDPQYE